MRIEANPMRERAAWVRGCRAAWVQSVARYTGTELRACSLGKSDVRIESTKYYYDGALPLALATRDSALQATVPVMHSTSTSMMLKLPNKSYYQ